MDQPHSFDFHTASFRRAGMSRCWGQFHRRVNDESSSGFILREMISARFCAEGMCFHSKLSVRVLYLGNSIADECFQLISWSGDPGNCYG
ncbi:hypothetical protein TNCV_1137681 [Trichonephila clavipes]|nr:hypothetical protein TNCV_1137681 [Trichonephila clavipes]